MDATSEVKDRLAIEDVVADYVTLKRSGANMTGLCPFHEEKTPSFMVSPAKNIFHCFGCNEGGDVLSFVMKMEGLEFREALEKLARRAGVDLSQYEGKSRIDSNQKDRLLRILDLSARYYQETLLKNPSALDYATNNRRITKNSLESFRIGYAPDRVDGLISFLRKRDVNPKDIQTVGLTNRRGQDFFRGRLMIPLTDNQGRVVGFTGRLIDESSFGPKYLNTPQTLLYDKGRHIFGLHQAKPAIREAGKVVLVEGNMDVVSSHQAGVANVVATAGTALTQDQIKQIGRVADKLVLAFDQDKAGVQATIRAIELTQGLHLRVYVAPKLFGKDPDEIIKNDPKAWSQALAQPIYVIDWVIDHFLASLDTKSGPGKVAFTDALLPVLAKISDPVEQDHYLTMLAGHIESNTSVLRSKLERGSSSRSPKPTTQSRAVQQSQRDEHAARVDTLLGMMLVFPETNLVSDQISVVSQDLSENQRQALASIRDQGRELPSHTSYETIIGFKAQELYGEWEPKDRAIEAMELAQRVIHEINKKKLKHISQAIAEAESRGDKSTADSLLKELYNLTLKE